MGKLIDHLSIHGINIDLYLDKSELEFHAKVFDEILRDRDAVKLKHRIWKEVERVLNEQSEWVPIIIVKEMHPFVAPNPCFIGIEIERMYVSKRDDGKWFSSVWDDDNRLMHSRLFMTRDEKFSIPFVEDERHSEGNVYYIGYTEAKWIGLERLINKIGELKDKLRDLLGTDKGRALLESAGSHLMLELKTG